MSHAIGGVDQFAVRLFGQFSIGGQIATGKIVSLRGTEHAYGCSLIHLVFFNESHCHRFLQLSLGFL